jgi:hypothetical protein
VREVLEETGIPLLQQQQQQQQQPSAAAAVSEGPGAATSSTGGPAAAANAPSSSTTNTPSSSSSAQEYDQEVPRNLCRQPLHHPTAFAAVDSVIRDAQDQIKYHYAIIEVGTAAPAAPILRSMCTGAGAECLWHRGIPCIISRARPSIPSRTVYGRVVRSGRCDGYS